MNSTSRLKLPSRPKVLQVCHSCDPTASMESRLSWHRAVQSAREFDTWVLCQPQKYDAVERLLPSRPPIDGLTVVEIPEGRNDANCPFFYWDYHRFQKRALQVAEQLHDELHFDLVHQVSFCGYREPGYLWKLGVPFVWGPIGGTQSFPLPFLGQIGLKGAVIELVRNVINQWHLRYRGRVRNAARKAAHIYAANTTARDDFARHHCVLAELQLETALESLPELGERHDDERRSLRILWAGRFCHWKAFPILARALSRLKDDVEFELRVMGFGPEEHRWRRQVQGAGISERTQFVGWPTYEGQQEQHAWADVFAFTSLRDTSGTGLLEALAHGCPVITVDHQGAADIITPESGIKVPVSSPTQTVCGFEDSIRRLAEDREFRMRLSHGARLRAEDYTWNGLGQRMREVYHKLVESSKDAKCSNVKTTGVFHQAEEVASPVG